MTTGTRDLLIEIGTEELPPKALQRLAHDYLYFLKSALQDAELLSGDPEPALYYSPRRLAILASEVRERQPECRIERHGPAVSVAYDDSGQPSKAAEGFARACGTTVDQLSEKDGKLFFAATEPGKPAAALIPGVIETTLARLPIPKRMRWGSGKAEFVRPIHWAAVLFGNDVIDCEIMGIRTGRRTRGHRFHHPQPIELASPADYVPALHAAKVWLNDREQRLNREISTQVARLVRHVDGYALNSEPDSELVAEVAALVEWPVPLRGSFDPAFLELPEEVLIATLEDQQRYFAIRELRTEQLLPYFIAVANIESRDPDQVRAGNERVIVPRLADAMFFWQTDRATPLAARIPELDHITFQRQLGSIGDKMRRVGQLAGLIAEALGSGSDKAERAATLAKCDLLSQLVGEFPELQGTVGCYLARHDGEDAEVAQAIGEHYQPRYAGDELPQSSTGQALAAADKLDTLIGIFAIGQAPTGEKDPFALRRAALGVLRILIEAKLDLDLEHSLQQTAMQFDAAIKADKVVTPVFDFMMERLRRYYLDSGVTPDVFEAVLARRPTRPLDFHRRLQAVQSFRKRPEAKSLAAANKRIGNILKQAKGTLDVAEPGDVASFTGHTIHKRAEPIDGNLNREALQDPAEKKLARELDDLRAKVEPLLADNQYEQALAMLAGLRDSVDAFFDNVMVMCEDEKLRRNRIALLAGLSNLFQRTADISRLQ